jgi:hypothetical protein
MTDTMTSQNIVLSSWDTLYSLEYIIAILYVHRIVWTVSIKQIKVKNLVIQTSVVVFDIL